MSKLLASVEQTIDVMLSEVLFQEPPWLRSVVTVVPLIFSTVSLIDGLMKPDLANNNIPALVCNPEVVPSQPTTMLFEAIALAAENVVF